MSKKYLLNPLFVLALVTLLLNDFVFKSAFSNFLTGKLSDLAGIVVLSLFLRAFFPERKLAVSLFVILAFTFWKSPASTPFISFLNENFAAGYSRVVDFTDLFCLLILLPLSRFEPKENQKTALLNMTFVPLSALTLFALLATSRARPEDFGYIYVNKEIPLKTTKQHFLTLLTEHGVQYKMTNAYKHKGDSIENYELQKFLVNSDTIYRATISLNQVKQNKLVLRLNNFNITERGTPIQIENYDKRDSIFEGYKKNVIGYFESYKQSN